MTKERFIETIEKTGDRKAAMKHFCMQYHYFSVHQIQAFSELLTFFPTHDRESLAELAKTVFEELGSGDPERVHSLLFEKFAAECDVDVSRLPLAPSEVEPGVKAYLDALYDAFSSRSLPRALGAYVFLEQTAVDMYPLFYKKLSRWDFTDEGLQFFYEHAELEPKHLETAKSLVERQSFSETDAAIYEAEQVVLEKAYSTFWDALMPREPSVFELIGRARARVAASKDGRHA